MLDVITLGGGLVLQKLPAGNEHVIRGTNVFQLNRHNKSVVYRWLASDVRTSGRLRHFEAATV